MMAERKKSMAGVHLLSLRIDSEQAVVAARQRARLVAEALGFPRQDQIGIATAVSEIARNAWQYGGGGMAEYLVDPAADVLRLVISDAGPGIRNLDRVLDGDYESATGMGIGITGARRLMHEFAISSTTQGTTVQLCRRLPAGAPRNAQALAGIAARLHAQPGRDALAELTEQNRELIEAMEQVGAANEALQTRELELSRINQELEDTNRGVVALYAELDTKADELRRANEVKSRFLSYMSHEFRTPLNSITALTALLLGRTDGDLTAEQDKQIGLIRRAAGELYEMVNDLLDLARVEAGRTDVEIGPCDTGQLFSALRTLMRPLLVNDAVALVFEEAQFSIWTDERKVTQILRNLISNALKFTERGEIRVSARLFEGRTVFTVSDTGIGIAADQQERIFQEFAQVENPIQKRVRGTGLGLPLSRKLAELLAGTLAVSSQPGVGSVFTLEVPDRSPAAPVTEEAAAAAPMKAREESATILIIDDDEVSRYVIRRMLVDSPWTLLEAANGPEGAERARFEQPSLIVLDLLMPGVSGFEVLDMLRGDPATRDIPVLIHSSKSLGAHDLARLAGRHDGILPKIGLQAEDLQEAVRVALDAHR